MSHTMFEKIILAHTDQERVHVGDIVEVPVDRVMIHDLFAPFCFRKFEEMLFRRVAIPDKVVLVCDHLVPTTRAGDAAHHEAVEKFAAEHRIGAVHRADGVCHQLLPEQGYVRPGDIVLGTDSHTVTYGALGALATGIGYTEMAAVLGTGRIWLKVVPTIRVDASGEFPAGVYAKDLILTVIGDLGSDGASYKAIELDGSAVMAMDISSRMTLSNMAVEAGAKVGLVRADATTLEFVGRRGSDAPAAPLSADEDAVYEKVVRYGVGDLVPMVACPFSVDNVRQVSECEGTRIDQAFLGSCTNGRVADIEVAARILSGRRISSSVRFIVVPASREVFREAARRGLIETLVEAGAVIEHPGCGLCCGRAGGILEDGERVISSSNRNFRGRMGGKDVEIYLASPAVVAASAVDGRIRDPRALL